MRVSSVEDTMPPIIGTMRCINSEPVPWLHPPHALDGAGPDCRGAQIGHRSLPGVLSAESTALRRAQKRAAVGTMSHWRTGERPVPSRGSLGMRRE